MASIAGVDISVISTAFEAKHDEITNNIFAKIKLFKYLREQGNVRVIDGGERINYPVMHGQNTTAKSYSGYGTLDTTPQEGIGNVEYIWRQYAVSVTISGREQRQVSGRFAIANLLEAKQMQAEMSLADTLNVDAFATQAGNNLEGLQTLVPQDPTTGTVGGIDRSAQTWWRSQQVDGASTATAFDELLSDMRNVYNSCDDASKGFGPPDIIITTQTVFEGYEGLVDSQRQFGNERMLNLGFDNLAFKQAGVIFDNDCPSGQMYQLNTKGFHLVMHVAAQLTPTEFVKPSNQDAMVAQILFQGNTVLRNSASNGNIDNIT